MQHNKRSETQSDMERHCTRRLSLLHKRYTLQRSRLPVDVSAEAIPISRGDLCLVFIA